MSIGSRTAIVSTVNIERADMDNRLSTIMITAIDNKLIIKGSPDKSEDWLTFPDVQMAVDYARVNFHHWHLVTTSPPAVDPEGVTKTNIM